MAEKNPPNTSTPVINPEEFSVFKELVENQKMKAQNEAMELQNRDKENERRFQFATKNLEHSADIEKDKPKNHRYNVLLYSGIGIVAFLVLSGFLFLLLIYGFENMARYIIYGAILLITNFFSYMIGNKKSNSNKENDMDQTGAIEI